MYNHIPKTSNAVLIILLGLGVCTISPLFSVDAIVWIGVFIGIVLTFIGGWEMLLVHFESKMRGRETDIALITALSNAPEEVLNVLGITLPYINVCWANGELTQY